MHKHHGNAALKAFHQFGTVTHHGAGEALFWAVVAVLVLIWLAALSGRRSRRRAQRTP